MSNYIREININEILYTEGTEVNLPFNEKGIIISVNRTALWGYRYKVKITDGGIFNNIGDTILFKADQFK